MATGCLCFLVGSYLGFNRGYLDGFDDGYEFAEHEMNLVWKATPQGESAPAAVREPVALSIHPSHLQLPI